MMKPFTDEWVGLRKTTRPDEAPRDQQQPEAITAQVLLEPDGSHIHREGVPEGAGFLVQRMAEPVKLWPEREKVGKINILTFPPPPAPLTPANFQSPDFHWPNPAGSQRSKDCGMYNLYSFPWHKAGCRRVESGFGEPERKYTAKSSKRVIIKD